MSHGRLNCYGYFIAPRGRGMDLYRFLTSAIFMARTFSGSPKRVMKPSASWWSYRSPVVKEARDSLYRE